VPAYPLTEAAHYLKMPSSTLRAWAFGQEYRTRQGKDRADSIITIAQVEPAVLSFYNLIEAHVLRALRTEHAVSMQNLRSAIPELRRQSSDAHPLASETLFAGHRQVYLEKYGQLMDLSLSSQLALKETVRAYLARIDWKTGFGPLRLFPFLRSQTIEAPRSVTIDPEVAFGRPVISGTRIATAEIRNRVDAGDSVEAVAEDLNQKVETVREVILFERAA